MQFSTMKQRYNAHYLLVYCDPKVHGVKTYNEVLRSLALARKARPIHVKQPEGEKEEAQVIYVLSTDRNLFLVHLFEDHPQAVLLGPDDQPVNLMTHYLKNLKKIEGLSVSEFLNKAANAEVEFAAKPGDDENKQNRLDTQKRIYSLDRFLMTRMYRENDLTVIKDSAKLAQFVTEALNGKRELYWESEKVKPQKYSDKVVGNEFERRVLESKRDSLILIYHPLAEKNRGLKEKFEMLAQNLGGSNDKLLIGRCNGLNESSAYLKPQKLPAIIYVQQNGS